MILHIVLASRASGCLLDTNYPKITPQDTKILWEVIFLNVNFKHIIDVFPPQYNSHDIVQWYHDFNE